MSSAAIIGRFRGDGGRSIRLALVIFAAVFARPALSQPVQPAPLADPDSALVDELVVTARIPGPAFWRVADADTTVYVLGVPSVAPKGLAWDRGRLEHRLEGANLLILPFNTIKVGVLGAPGALFNVARLRSSKPYEERAPADLKARFAAAREAIGHPAKDYRTNNGVVAGLLLVSHYRDFAKLTAADPAKTIGRLAQARKVRVSQKSYAFGPLSGSVLRASAAAQTACLRDALDEIDAGPEAARRAGAGWARGDVGTALTAERGFEKCLAATPGGLAFDAKIKADQAAAVAEAMKTPGHAVAVIPLRTLLAQGGVLDRLRAQGFQIQTPGDED